MVDNINVGKAILASNLTQEEKIEAIVAVSRPINGGRTSGANTRRTLLECLLIADHPVRIAEIRETLGKNNYWVGEFTQQMLLLVRCGAVIAKKVDTGKTITIEFRNGPKEVPERYNVYSLNI